MMLWNGWIASDLDKVRRTGRILGSRSARWSTTQLRSKLELQRRQSACRLAMIGRGRRLAGQPAWSRARLAVARRPAAPVR